MGDKVPMETVIAWMETRKDFYYAMLPVENEKQAMMVPILATKDAKMFALEIEFRSVGPRGKISYPCLATSYEYRSVMDDFEAEKAAVDAWYIKERNRIVQQYIIKW